MHHGLPLVNVIILSIFEKVVVKLITCKSVNLRHGVIQNVYGFILFILFESEKLSAPNPRVLQRHDGDKGSHDCGV
jgi:hypothetical protein